MKRSVDPGVVRPSDTNSPDGGDPDAALKAFVEHAIVPALVERFFSTTASAREAGDETIQQTKPKPVRRD